ncbi:MAG: endonuclease VII domain-containing protein [Actinobacteria bacterium]|nr:endonuclease VII domain-containing protein [Actinomycetota bacterium]
MKRCKHCGDTKSVDLFYRDTAARDGLRPECKACTATRRKAWYEQNKGHEIARVKAWQVANSERHLANQRQRRAKPEVKAREREGYLLRKYGITQARYDELLAKQGGVCAICDRPPSDKISLHVDHSHGDGAIRGLLCFRCNNALGDLGDDPATLKRAIAYLTPPSEGDLRIAALVRARLERELLRQR